MYSLSYKLLFKCGKLTSILCCSCYLAIALHHEALVGDITGGELSDHVRKYFFFSEQSLIGIYH